MHMYRHGYMYMHPQAFMCICMFVYTPMDTKGGRDYNYNENVIAAKGVLLSAYEFPKHLVYIRRMLLPVTQYV